MADLSGTTLGKYQVIERLGRGGMAEVYRAYQPSMDRYVAIKVMHAYLAEDEGFTERFKREAKSVGALRHPNIVQVIDFDVADNIDYMVMEFIPGDTLKARLERQGALPIGEALDIAIKLADGLTYAHHEGMLHRDIKPANVLFTKSGEPVLTDFGVARIMGSTHLTASGAIVGTPAYMSPEAARGEQVDERTDIYSLGIVLYEMLTGAVPFDADTPYAVIFKQINDPLPMPRQYVPDLPDDLERLLLRSLAKEKEARYQTSDDFLAALRAARQNLPHTLTTAVGKKTEPQQAKLTNAKTVLGSQSGVAPRRSTLPLLLAGLAVVVIAGLVLIGSGALGQATPTPVQSSPTVVAAAPTNTTPPSSAPTAITGTETPPGPTKTEQPPKSTRTPSATNTPRATTQDEAKYATFTAQIEQQVRDGHYDDALKAVEDALRSDPKAYDLLMLHGLVLVEYRDNKERLDAGKAEAEAAISIDADRPEAYIVLGIYYNFSPVDDPEQARKYYTLAVDKGSNEPIVFFLRANINRYRSDVTSDAVIADYDRAVSLDPQNAQFYLERGRYLANVGKLRRAQSDLEHSLRLYPNTYIHNELAALYLLNQEGEKAFNLYAGTIDAEKTTDAVYLAHGAFIAWMANHKDKAAEWAHLALLIEPKASGASYVEALLARDAGRYDDALALLKPIQEVDPGSYSGPFFTPRFDRWAAVDYARLLVAAGRIDEALQAYVALIDHIPSDWGQPYIELARLYKQKGQFDEARSALVRALDISQNTKDEALRKVVLDELEKVRQGQLEASPTSEPTSAP